MVFPDPKTPKSEDGGNDSEVGESSPDEVDQNSKKPRTIFSREQVSNFNKSNVLYVFHAL